MRYFFGFLVVLIFIGCAGDSRVRDLDMPQDALVYIPKIQDSGIDQDRMMALKQGYLNEYFLPWSNPEPTANADEVFWIKNSLSKGVGYGESLEKNDPKNTTKILENMDIDNYPSVKTLAIIIKDTSVRAVPSIKPMFYNKFGYPFDRWQNSLIFYGTPILVTHYDKSRRFAHIQNSFIHGWVEVSDIAYVKQNDAQNLMRSKDFFISKLDDFAILDSKNNFITQARIGGLFIASGENRIKTFKKGVDGYVIIGDETINGSYFIKFPNRLSDTEIANTINLMLGQRYGWGGIYENRDCSAFIRDLFSSFGVWLPRNSRAQFLYGENMVDLSKMDSDQKENYIIENATPYLTLLWMKGHIMLYLGVDKDGRAIIAHSSWSVSNGDLFSTQESKLGGVVITTLKPGEEKNGFFGAPKLIIDKIEGMNDLSKSVYGNQEYSVDGIGSMK